jgi:peptide/nickel transport system permease protein
VLLVVVIGLSFGIVDLPFGSFVDRYEASLEAKGLRITDHQSAHLRDEFTAVRPEEIHFSDWLGGLIRRGDLGLSLDYDRPVVPVILNEGLLSTTLAFGTAFAVWFGSLARVISSVRAPEAQPNRQRKARPLLIAVVASLVLTVALGVAAIRFLTPDNTVPPALWTASPTNRDDLAAIARTFGSVLLSLVLVHLFGVIRVIRRPFLHEVKRRAQRATRRLGQGDASVALAHPARYVLPSTWSTVLWIVAPLTLGEICAAVSVGTPTSAWLILQALLTQDTYLAGALLLIVGSQIVLGVLTAEVLVIWLDF